MTEKTMVDVSGRRRLLLRVGLDHWADALKRVSSRVQGMGYPRPAVAMRRDRDLIEGDDQSQGLLERLRPQGNLLEEEDEIPDEDGQVAMSHDELRVAYYALRKHRERILDLKRSNEKEEYEPEEQERDLAIIGEPAGDDGQSSGFLNELDLGWEEDPPDPRQMEMTAGAGKSEPSTAPSDETEPSTDSGTEARSSDTESGSGDTSDADEKVAGSVNGRRGEIMEYVEDRLREDASASNKELQAAVVEEFPDAGIEDLSPRQFNARYPLQVKRKMATEG